MSFVHQVWKQTPDRFETFVMSDLILLTQIVPTFYSDISSLIWKDGNVSNYLNRKGCVGVTFCEAGNWSNHVPPLLSWNTSHNAKKQLLYNLVVDFFCQTKLFGPDHPENISVNCHDKLWEMKRTEYIRMKVDIMFEHLQLFFTNSKYGWVIPVILLL